MLTGKNLENFIDWLHQYMMTQTYGSKFRFIEQFDALPLSMQWGILQDYTDSIGYEIVIQPWNYKMCESFEGDKTYSYSIHREYKWLIDGCDYSTRDEARKAAIKAFDEIVNKNN